MTSLLPILALAASIATIQALGQMIASTNGYTIPFPVHVGIFTTEMVFGLILVSGMNGDER